MKINADILRMCQKTAQHSPYVPIFDPIVRSSVYIIYLIKRMIIEELRAMYLSRGVVSSEKRSLSD